MIVEEVKATENISDVEDGECTDDDSDDILSSEEEELNSNLEEKISESKELEEKEKEDTDSDIDSLGRRYRSKSPKPVVKKEERSYPKEKGLNYFSDGEQSDSEDNSRNKGDDWCWRRKAGPGELDNDFDGLLKGIGGSKWSAENQQRNGSWRNGRGGSRNPHDLRGDRSSQPQKFQMRRQPRPPRRVPKPFPTPQKKQPPFKPFPKPPPKQPPPPPAEAVPDQQKQRMQVWTEPKEPWTGPRRYDLQCLQITAAPPPPLPSTSESWTKVYSKDTQRLDRSIKEKYPDKKQNAEAGPELTESRKRQRDEFESYPLPEPSPRRRRRETSPRRHRSRRSGRRGDRSISRERSKNGPRNLDDDFYKNIRSKEDHSSDDQDRRPLRLRGSRNSSSRRKRKRSSSRSPRKSDRPARSKQMIADFPTPSKRKLHTNKDTPMSEKARRKAQTYESYGDERVYICYPDENGKMSRKFSSYPETKTEESSRDKFSSKQEHYHESHDRRESKSHDRRRRKTKKRRKKKSKGKKSMLMDSSSSEESGSSSDSEGEEEITVTKEVINLANNDPPAESLMDRYPLEKKEELKNKLLKLAEEKTTEQNADEVEEGFGKTDSDSDSEEVKGTAEVIEVDPDESEVKKSAEVSSEKVATNEESEEKEATESRKDSED